LRPREECDPQSKEIVVRRVIVAVAFLVSQLGPATAASVAGTSGCQFQLGFLALANLIPTQVGSCLDNESFNPDNGDTLQHTSGGLLVWRKADNWTAFTDGFQTWINGPHGLQQRPNNERFAWEFNADGLPVVGQAASTVNGPCPVTPTAVIAVENFYGNLLGQLGGQCVSVTSIITDPLADPHVYQPTASDAKSYQTAQFIVENGLGYDDFSDKLIGTLTQKPTVLNVGAMLGLKVGDNPHVWYSPSDVDKIVQAITANLKQVNPGAGGYFDSQASFFQNGALAPYHAALQQLQKQFKGVPVASTESIFVYMAQATGLNLVSPPTFMDAISEGNDPTAQDLATFQNLITSHQIKVLVYNTQTVTNITDQLKAMAIANKIPIVGVSETMPLDAQTFQGWQATQLQELIKALASTSS
jgi:zinc/manganese transport system substrate-binding protein